MQKSLCSNGMLIVMLPLSLFLLALSLHLLGTSASHYLSPALK
jgi:Ca2+/Na+ antiporter